MTLYDDETDVLKLSIFLLGSFVPNKFIILIKLIFLTVVTYKFYYILFNFRHTWRKY